MSTVYRHTSAHADDPGWWGSERAFYTGLGADPTTAPATQPWYAKVAETLVPVAANIYQQRQLTKLNIARIQQGQPPITAAEFTQVYQPPTAQVEVGVARPTQQMLLWGALGIGALILFTQMRGRR